MYRANGARTGRVTVHFPTTVMVIRRIPLFADLATGPVVDSRGRLVVATKDGKLVEITQTGAVAYTLTLDAPAVQGPILLSNGTRFVVTRDGVAAGVSAEGTVVFTAELGAARGALLAEPLATRDGAAIVALGSRVYKIGAEGETRATATVDEPVAAITETADAVFLATETGRVFQWNPPGDPRPVGSFGGKPSGEVVALDRGRLVTVARGTALVELDVRDGVRSLDANLAPDVIADTPGVTPQPELRVSTRAGLLLGFAGPRETLRHAEAPPGALPMFSFSDAALPPLVDVSGATAFVTPAASVGVLPTSGDARTTTIPECGPPAAFIPAADRVLAVFCRSGFIALVGNGGEEPTAAPGPSTGSPTRQHTP
jgi:hypothetical protein